MGNREEQISKQKSIPNDSFRINGTKKGNGWLGPLPMQDGSGKIATEITIDVDTPVGRKYLPLLVPTLDQEGINHLLKGGKPTPQIFKKAIRHAVDRWTKGFSAYAD